MGYGNYANLKMYKRVLNIPLKIVASFLLEISVAVCFNLTILHTNDIHGRIEETDRNGFSCDPAKDTCFGGVARIATAVKEVRKKEQNVVLVDGGDRITGAIWSEVYKGNATSVLFNKLNYTAITLGNHDFDYGLKTLVHFLEQIMCPVVVSNMNTSQEPMWPNKAVQTSVIVNLNGEKVGFVGYIVTETSRTSNSGENIKFLPIISSVQKAVQELEIKGITKIIAVGHAGFEVDKEIARKVIGVDVVVGGHSNTFLYSGLPPSAEKPEGPYPFIVHPDHNKNLSIPVIQAYYYTKYLGNLQVTFNDVGDVTGWSGNPVLLDSTVAKDQHVENIIKKMKVLVDEKGDEKIGKVKMSLSATNCGSGPCVLGKTTALAMAYHYRSFNASIAMFRADGIRQPLSADDQGYVLYKELFQSFPYRNTIDMVELTGADLKRSIETSGYLQLQGLRVKFSSAPVRRIEDIQVKDMQCSTDDCFVPLNLTRTYKVVSDSYFIAVSNRVIVQKGMNRVRGPSIYDVLVEYFKAKYPVKNKDMNSTRKLKQSHELFLLILLAVLTGY